VEEISPVPLKFLAWIEKLLTVRWKKKKYPANSLYFSWDHQAEKLWDKVRGSRVDKLIHSL
jgi:hypothetical protein